MKEELLSPLKWVSLFRITAITVILGIGIYFLRRYPFGFSQIPLWVIIGLTYLLTFVYWCCLKKAGFSVPILWVSVVIDVFIISAVVHYTGGTESLFVFLYLFPIVEASIFFFLKGSAIIATSCLSLYATLIGLEFHNLIPSIFPPPPPDLWDLYTNLYLRATFFYLIAVTSGYLAERVRQKSQALEQMELDTSTILQSMKSGLLVLDYKGSILYKNTLAEKILGVPIKQSIEELNPPIRDLIGSLCIEGFQEITLSSKIIGVHTSKLRGREGKDRGVVLVLDDLTDSIITKRLAVIGKFSGDLAHEIRNPLTAIQGAVELIREGVNKVESNQLLGNILAHTRRLNEIVTNFLSFAKPIPLKIEEVDISEILNEAISLAPNKINVQVIGNTKIKLDKAQMRTAFLNLIINAYEAKQGDTPCLQPQGQSTSCPQEGGSPLLRRQELTSDPYLQITVVPPLHKYLLFEEERKAEEDEIVVNFKDRGKGIADSEIAQIFTPFYTTKKGGVGLGLSIVSKIIESHKGRIEVKSKLGKGTIFAIHLPYEKSQ